MKRIIATIIAIAVLLSLSSYSTINVHASVSQKNEIEKIDAQKIIELINDIEGQLREKGTDVKSELKKFSEDIINTYEISYVKKYNKMDSHKSVQVLELKKTVDKMIDSYGSKSLRSSEDMTIICENAVTAITAWFVTQNYMLAAELLAHARQNNSYGSNYSPSYGNRVEASAVFWALRNNTAITSGSGEFKNIGSTYEKDLYYGIHLFNWYKTSGTFITITDFYDFAVDKQHYNNIQNYAIGTMVLAQSLGVITPYNVVIVHN
ncbi:MAG: hypothetical protein K6G45_02775 [Lachnospiraceae bacterium]|nr:hypothetical protein [Lachnospiraceae bacterium]